MLDSKSSVQQCTVGSNPTLSARYFKASEHFARKPFFFAYDRLLAVCYGQAEEANVFMSVQSIKTAFLCLPSMDIILSEGTALFRRYPQQPAKGLFLPLCRVLPAGLPMRCRFRPLASLPDVPHATRLVSAAKHLSRRRASSLSPLLLRRMEQLLVGRPLRHRDADPIERLADRTSCEVFGRTADSLFPRYAVLRTLYYFQDFCYNGFHKRPSLLCICLVSIHYRVQVSLPFCNPHREILH